MKTTLSFTRGNRELEKESACGPRTRKRFARPNGAPPRARNPTAPVTAKGVPEHYWTVYGARGVSRVRFYRKKNSNTSYARYCRNDEKAHFNTVAVLLINTNDFARHLKFYLLVFSCIIINFFYF